MYWNCKKQNRIADVGQEGLLNQNEDKNIYKSKAQISNGRNKINTCKVSEFIKIRILIYNSKQNCKFCCKTTDRP